MIRWAEAHVRYEASGLVGSPSPSGQFTDEPARDLRQLLVGKGLVPVEESTGVVPGNVFVGIRVKSGFVDGGFSRLQQLTEVPCQELPREEVVLVTVRAVKDRPLDALGAQHLLEDLDVYEVLAQGLPVVIVERFVLARLFVGFHPLMVKLIEPGPACRQWARGK